MGGCSSSKEELRQIQKKVALRGDPSIIKEFGNFMRLQKGGILIPTELGKLT